MNKNSKASLAMLIGSMTIFGTVGIFRRNIEMSSGVIAFARGVIGTIVIALFMKLTGRRILSGVSDAKSRMKLIGLAVTGAIMGFNWIFLFEAYNYTSVSVATLCYYMEPTIVVIASTFLFNEKMSTAKAICAAVSLLGMVLVSGILGGGVPGTSGAKGIAFGLAAALFYSIVVLMNKKMSDVDPYEKTVVQLGAAALAMIPYLAITGGFAEIASGNLGMQTVALILIMGLLHTGIAYVLYFGSINGLRAQTVAIFSYVDPIVALILSALILHESMSLAAVVGSVMIIGAAVVNEIKS